ncbi:hypothetical protein GHT06_004673 [Daphnia sinensis]|uniref:Uncharacterized protein n=1 Tax=Daphnia sinensis TaxID=1820382 RepID=A0AAD5KW99_9CRUS|nr:hypothetical protein GHT06_005401 [Daphnia sinensis]KAI9550863.1 hypothetical protein GHT06_004673 [Daphnia sinensis]
MNKSTLKTLISETEGENGCSRQYVKLTNENGVVCIDSNSSSNVRFRGVKHLLSSVFLPQGYPSSVSDDYLEYQIWDTIQAFASSLSGSLSTRAILEGVGVGSSTSTPLAATLMWLIKDGTGMIGRILFAWCNGTKLDADSKKWRFFADLLNDCALSLELCAPYAVAAVGGSNGAMTGILCVSGVAKSIVGVAGGATRAALTQHQARQGNLADVSAKDGSQETLVNLAALITSLWLLPFLDGSTKMTWFSFFLFTLLHVFANLKAVKAVTMETLNRTRYMLILKQFASSKDVPSVKVINRLEPVVMGLIPTEKDVCGYRIELGSSIKAVASNKDLENQLAVYSDRNFALIPHSITKTIYIIYRQECMSEEMLESYSHAVLAAMLASGYGVRGMKPVVEGDISGALLKMVNESCWKELRNGLVNQGWILNHSLLAAGEWRASWVRLKRDVK